MRKLGGESNAKTTSRLTFAFFSPKVAVEIMNFEEALHGPDETPKRSPGLPGFF
jgi:hypothetical protein